MHTIKLHLLLENKIPPKCKAQEINLIEHVNPFLQKSFIQKIFIEYLLYAKPGSRHW